MLNLRRPLFQDIRVREALGYTYDFDTVNRYGLYKRANSLFNNSEFAAQGLPSPGELKLLEPFRNELPPAVFGPPFVAPRTGSDPKRAAPQPAEGARAARAGRLEAGARRQAAQRQGRGLRVRVPEPRRGRRAHGRLAVATWTSSASR